MVDVGGKEAVRRTARASAVIRIHPSVIAQLKRRALPKGDALAVAKVAAIQAAKRTAELIPLCHPLRLAHVGVACAAQEEGVRITATVTAVDRTGVEMEALCAASVAALTIYDMCKAADPAMVIGPVRLEEKTGGKRDFKRRASRSAA
jgi:cyclic pyranopterin phosphate synthase